MQVLRTISELRRLVTQTKKAGCKVGFVPTMGALHAGHLSLIATARRETDFVLISIFVNPTQFGPNEDLGKYPRPETQDLELCEQAGVDAIFLPSVEEMYPPGHGTIVEVRGLSEKLCGAYRPGHFAGVATVVAKLFNIVGPNAAYFGQKDVQQGLIIRKMVADLDIPVRVLICPTVRETDGLAMSSRNIYLKGGHRQQATCLYRALQEAERMIRAGERNAQRVEAVMKEIIAAAGPCTIDYTAAVDEQTLEPAKPDSRIWLLAVAVRIGQTRLIDNIRVELAGDECYNTTV